MGWTLHMIMCVPLCYPVSFHMLQLLLTGRPISSCSISIDIYSLVNKFYSVIILVLLINIVILLLSRFNTSSLCTFSFA